MNVIILESARRSIVEGYGFYEEQTEGLGAYFRDSILKDLRSLRIYAGIHAIFFSDYYRMTSKHFPFAIYYKIEDNTAVVYAVYDCRRDPSWIFDQLNKN